LLRGKRLDKGELSTGKYFPEYMTNSTHQKQMRKARQKGWKIMEVTGFNMNTILNIILYT